MSGLMPHFDSNDSLLDFSNFLRIEGQVFLGKKNGKSGELDSVVVVDLAESVESDLVSIDSGGSLIPFSKTGLLVACMIVAQHRAKTATIATATCTNDDIIDPLSHIY